MAVVGQRGTAGGWSAGIEAEIRLFSQSDSVDELTELLHRAYAQLAAMGQRFVATYQSSQVTLERIGQGECFVAVVENQIVGTIVLRRPGFSKGTSWYRQQGVACFGQFGVDPAWQGRGIGRKLLAKVEERARELGATELALDTSENAHHLIDLYERWGFRFVEYADWEITNYRSVVMSKALLPEGVGTER